MALWPMSQWPTGVYKLWFGGDISNSYLEYISFSKKNNIEEILGHRKSYERQIR